MIVSDLANLRDQVVLTPNMEKAIEFLLQSGQDDLPAGRVTVDGENVFVEVQAYDTIASGDVVFEGHRKYADIQYVVEGEEIIAWASLDDVSTFTREYGTDGHDAWLGAVPAEKTTNVHLTSGQLTVLYPSDAHAPRRAVGASAPVRKLVVKVAL